MSEKKTVKKSMDNVTVEVVSAKFGTYKKGDEIVMHRSTAEACEKNQAVKILGSKTAKKSESK